MKKIELPEHVKNPSPWVQQMLKELTSAAPPKVKDDAVAAFTQELRLLTKHRSKSLQALLKMVAASPDGDTNEQRRQALSSFLRVLKTQ